MLHFREYTPPQTSFEFLFVLIQHMLRHLVYKRYRKLVRRTIPSKPNSTGSKRAGVMPEGPNIAPWQTKKPTDPGHPTSSYVKHQVQQNRLCFPHHSVLETKESEINPRVRKAIELGQDQYRKSQNRNRARHKPLTVVLQLVFLLFIFSSNYRSLVPNVLASTYKQK